MRKLHMDKDAVSNVVTSIMLFGIIISTLTGAFAIYAPIYGKSQEAKHLDETQNQFMAMKEHIDEQVLREDTVLSTTSMITLGTEGGPIMGIGRSSGSLTMEPNQGTCIVASSDDDLDIFGRARGGVIFESTNGYVEDRNFIYEFGAILLFQGNTAIMKVEPNLAFTIQEDMPIMSMTLITLSGDLISTSGQGTELVKTRLVLSQTNQFQWDTGEDLTLNLSTSYPEVWQDYFNSTLVDIGLEEDTDGNGTGDDGNFTITTIKDEWIEVEIRDVYELNIKVAVVEATID